ncbi:MAG: PhzF family phenazine biosynthesis protein [Pseudohongiellaceae bacterium]
MTVISCHAFFALLVGINEDPVTGSIHCSLIPYWHRITGKQALQAR